MFELSTRENNFRFGTVCYVLPVFEKMRNSSKFKRLQMGGGFFVVRHRSKRKVETRSLEAFVLACKKLSLFEQVFVMEKFCLNVAEIANCSNPGLEIERKLRSNAKKRQGLFVPLLRKPNLPFKREKLNIREECGDLSNRNFFHVSRVQTLKCLP